ncbi:MAG TPA: glycosyltransferase [Gaiellaceae bacterium]|nr:glycosyltransferase [Gaiellaceae bacterium]
MIQNKGIWIAAQIADKLDKHLIMAGSGVTGYGDGWVEADGLRMEGNLSYVGAVAGKARTDLMRKADAVLSPTLYIEPFGAVAVEAQLCGIPAVTTDWGAFPGTVVNGLNGYRFRTLTEGVEAVKKSARLDPMTIANHARSKYRLDAIAPLYDNWFQRLDGLRDKGWMGDY